MQGFTARWARTRRAFRRAYVWWPLQAPAGTVFSERGLDVAALSELKASGRSVTDLAGAKVLDRDAVIEVGVRNPIRRRAPT